MVKVGTVCKAIIVVGMYSKQISGHKKWEGPEVPSLSNEDW